MRSESTPCSQAVLFGITCVVFAVRPFIRNKYGRGKRLAVKFSQSGSEPVDPVVLLFLENVSRDTAHAHVCIHAQKHACECRIGKPRQGMN